MAIVYIINIMPIGLAAEIYVPGTSYEGVTFIANDTGTYRFTMTGGAARGPDYTGGKWCGTCMMTACWTTVIRIYKNRDIYWGSQGDDCLNVPMSPDYEVGTQHYRTLEEADTANKGKFVDIPLKEGDRLLFTVVDYQDSYDDNVGGVTFDVETQADILKTPTPIQPSSTITPNPIKTQKPEIENSETENSELHVSLYGEKIDVTLREDVLLRLSAVNIIDKPIMTVQVILYPPSGMSVTAQEFVKSGTGIYTTTYILEPGDSKDIEIKIRPNQIGDFNVKGTIVYYFGDDKKSTKYQTLTLPIKVRKEADVEVQNPVSVPTQKSPGFEIIVCVIILLIARLSNRHL